MKVALDTNVLAYAEGVNAGSRHSAAVDLLERIPRVITVVPVQALGELFNVLVKKAGRSRSDARASVLNWCDVYSVAATSPAAMIAAADLAANHRLAIWDAVILAVAAEAGCRLLLSEDMQESFTWNGVTVTNPFAASRHVLLEALLTDAQ